MNSAMTTTIGRHSVSRVGLGGAGFSIRETQDENAAVAVIRAAHDAGITHFDTARAYATVSDPFHNERLFARAVGGLDVLVATKGGHFRSGRETWGIDASPDALRRDCEGSLRALGIEAIGLYYLHHPDPEVPIEESVGTLSELRAEGKIEAIGVCNVDAVLLERVMATTDIAAVQNRFSPLGEHDTDVLERCAAAGIAHVAYSPLGGQRLHSALGDLLPNTARLALQRERSVESVLLRWLLEVSPAMSVLSGAGREASAVDSASALAIDLDEETIGIVTEEISANAGVIPRS